MTGHRIEVFAPDGVPEIEPGADLALLIRDILAPRPGDVVMVTSKVISKAEGRARVGDRSAHLESETSHVVAKRGDTQIVRTHHGLTMAAAGIDESNVATGQLLLLPGDPDASARDIRSRLADLGCGNVAVVITDTAGRAWRVGQTDMAIGAAGLRVVEDFAGAVDGYGNVLRVTAPAVADEIAGAAELAQGKLGGRPFALLRGRADLVRPPGDDGPGAVALLRPLAQDLFGYGAREAVIRALQGRDGDRAPFGGAVPPEELAEVLAGFGLAATAGQQSLEVPITTDRERWLVETMAFAHGWSVQDLRVVGLETATAWPVRLRLQPFST